MEKFNSHCHSCGHQMNVTEMECPTCSIKLNGTIRLPLLARLSSEERDFIELFILCGGSLKEVGKAQNLSYPTVRQKLDKLISKIKIERDPAQRLATREAVLTALSNAEIDVSTASALLKKSKV